MKFNEAATVENHILKFLEQKLGYEYIPAEKFAKLRELEQEYIIVPLIRDALKKINKSDDETELQNVIRQVKSIERNEDFLNALRYGVDITDSATRKTKNYKLLDFENPANNHFVVTNQFYFAGNAENIRPDILIFVNGIPLVDIEAKSATVKGVNFEDGIGQIKRYERNARSLFVPNCFNIATDGHATVYGATYASKQYFLRWRDEELAQQLGGDLEMTLQSLLEPSRILDIIQNFILFEKTAEGTIKKIARYQQMRAANKLVQRVRDGKDRRGLVWHTQGSGKSLTMFFAAWKLRFDPAFQNPKVFVVVDRVDLDDQIFEVFMNCGGKNVERVTSRENLAKRIESGAAGIYITTMQKFDELPKGVVDSGEFTSVLIDEAHRTGYGDYGIHLRSVLPNAFLFAFTGTPIEKAHREFGVANEKHFERYLDYYSIKQAVEDHATVPVAYEARLSKFAIDNEELDAQFDLATADLSSDEKHALIAKFGRKEALIKLPKRMKAISQDIFEHFKAYVEPSGFKAQVVCYDREAAALYKQMFDTLMPKEYSEVVYSEGDRNADNEELRRHVKTKQEIKTIIERFKNPNDSLKFLIVCDMLLTGFDAPIEQTMYLDKPLWGHNLLQAVARTNRIEQGKEYGKIIDYYGMTRNLIESLDFDEREIEDALTDITHVKEQFGEIFERVAQMFEGVNTEDPRMENLRKCLGLFEGDEAKQKEFVEAFKKLRSLFEVLSPDPFLKEYIRKVEWFACFYAAFQKEYGDDASRIDVYAIIAEYGPKLRKLVQEKVDYEGITRNYREMRLDHVAELEKRYGEDDNARARGLERTLVAEITIHTDAHPVFKSFAERLEKIRKDFEDRQINLVERIKQYEALIKDVQAAEARAGEVGLSLREYALYGFSEEYIEEQEKGMLVKYAKELGVYLDDILEPLWQDSSRREDLLKDIKRQIQQMILSDYKERLTVKDFPKYLNRLVDVILKKWM